LLLSHPMPPLLKLIALALPTHMEPTPLLQHHAHPALPILPQPQSLIVPKLIAIAMKTIMEMPKHAKIVRDVLTRVPSKLKTPQILPPRPIAQIRCAIRTLTLTLRIMLADLAEQMVLLMAMAKKLLVTVSVVLASTLETQGVLSAPAMLRQLLDPLAFSLAIARLTTMELLILQR